MQAGLPAWRDLVECAGRRSAPSDYSEEVNEKDRRTRRLTKTRAADAWLP